VAEKAICEDAHITPKTATQATARKNERFIVNGIQTIADPPTPFFVPLRVFRGSKIDC
jgi:hypothetical protein